MAIKPYLFFDGRTEEALEYYRKTLGAEIATVMRFKDSPDGPPPGYNIPPDKVIHAEMRVNGTQVMASDGMQCAGKPSFSGFSLTYEASDAADAKRRFDARQIFVNLPAQDLERSKQFFSSLGFGFDPQFTDDIADAKSTSEVLLALSCSSDKEVDDLITKATAAGGKTIKEPQDHGFMYYRAFEDPDGHIWELVHMRGEPQ